MPKVRILGSIDEKARAALITLLREAGIELSDEDACDEKAADDLGEESVEEPEAQDDLVAAPGEEEVGVVVLTPECSEAPDLEQVMLGASNRGCRVIGIWPQGAIDGRLPRAIEDYGAGVVPWDARRLKDAIEPTTTDPNWSTPDAQPRPQPITRRNRC